MKGLFEEQTLPDYLEDLNELTTDLINEGYSFHYSWAVSIDEAWIHEEGIKSVVNLIGITYAIYKSLESNNAIAFALFYTFNKMNKCISDFQIQKELTTDEFETFLDIKNMVMDNINNLKFVYKGTDPEILKECGIDLDKQFE